MIDIHANYDDHIPSPLNGERFDMLERLSKYLEREVRYVVDWENKPNMSWVDFFDNWSFYMVKPHGDGTFRYALTNGERGVIFDAYAFNKIEKILHYNLMPDDEVLLRLFA